MDEHITEYCNQSFTDLIDNFTLGFEQEFPALNFDPKKQYGRSYKKIKEILNSIKKLHNSTGTSSC